MGKSKPQILWKYGTPIKPIEAVITGIISNVGHIAPIDANRAVVKVAPTATPRIPRIAVFRTLIVPIRMPTSAANRHPRIGPSNHGNGSSKKLKRATPAAAIAKVLSVRIMCASPLTGGAGRFANAVQPLRPRVLRHPDGLRRSFRHVGRRLS